LIAAHRFYIAGKTSAVTAAVSGVHRDVRRSRPSASGGLHAVGRAG
jgi:hypothetical protein